MDDLLMRALDGDVEAAVALRQRQRDRAHLRRQTLAAEAASIAASKAKPHATTTVSQNMVVCDPHSHEQTHHVDGLITDALSGSGVWIGDGAAGALLESKPEADTGDSSLPRMLMQLDRMVMRHERLEHELASKRSSVDTLQRAVEDKAQVRDEKLSFSWF